jgi:hypothetical protein
MARFTSVVPSREISIHSVNQSTVILVSRRTNPAPTIPVATTSVRTVLPPSVPTAVDSLSPVYSPHHPSFIVGHSEVVGPEHPESREDLDRFCDALATGNESTISPEGLGAFSKLLGTLALSHS